MAALLFERDTGVKLEHVPYRTTPAGLMAVVNAEVAMGFYNIPLVISLIATGKLRPIAATAAQRSPLLPDVPSMREQGVKDYVFDTWMGFALPKGAPPKIVERLNTEIFRIAANPAVKAKMQAQGIDMMPATPPASMATLIKDDLALWLPIIKASGAAAE
jgi:tripartite-type tricarboxylate transporter receptor subunit TctC